MPAIYPGKSLQSMVRWRDIEYVGIIMNIVAILWSHSMLALCIRDVKIRVLAC